MAARKFKIGLNVDERTNEMSQTALRCRRYGHKWELAAMPRGRFLELARLGQAEENRYCENGCGGTWRELYDIGTGQILEVEKNYPSGSDYRMPKGAGRLHRDAARVALFARLHPEFV